MEEEFDLLELAKSFWKRKFWIIILTLFGAFIGLVYTRVIVVPKYSSEVTLILAKSSSTTTENITNYVADDSITQSDITLNQKLISTYAEILKSRRVSEKIINNLGLKTSYDDIRNSISVSSVKDTDVIKVTVTTTDAKRSKKIASELVNVFTEEVARIYNIQNVYIIDEAQINNNPVNVNYFKNIITFAIIGFALSCGIVFLFFYFDNTVKSRETVTKIMGCPVLATIPKLEGNKKGGRA